MGNIIRRIHCPWLILGCIIESLQIVLKHRFVFLAFKNSQKFKYVVSDFVSLSSHYIRLSRVVVAIRLFVYS